MSQLFSNFEGMGRVFGCCDIFWQGQHVGRSLPNHRKLDACRCHYWNLAIWAERLCRSSVLQENTVLWISTSIQRRREWHVVSAH